MAAITAAELQVLFTAQGVERVTGAVDTVDRKLQSGAASARAGGAALAGMAAVAAVGFKRAIGVTSDFDAQLSAIASVGGKDAQARLEDIRTTALKLGADTSFSASEAAAGMQEMIKAGLSVQDTLGGAARAALDLSAASGTAVTDSATIMSSMLNVFGDTLTGFATQADKATHIADLLAQAANASATDVQGLGLALQASGAIARGFGLSADQTATSLAILAQNGLASSDMGTSLKAMLLSLTRDTKPAKEALAKLGLSMEDLKDASGQFIGIEPMFDLFRRGAEEAGLSGLDLNIILNKLFGSDGGRAAQIFFRTTEDGWANMRAGMANAGTAGEQAAKRLDNLAGDTEKLNGAIETLTLSFTRFSTGPLRATVQMATRVINALSGLPPEVQQVIAIVGILGTALLGAVGIWGLFGEQIGLAIRGLALLSGPLLLIAGLVAVLALAWRNNWGGIQEITQNALNTVGEALTRMTRFFQAAKERGLTPFRLAFRTLIVTLAERLGRDHPAVEFLQGMLRNGERLAGWLTTDGIPTFRRFVRALTEGDFGRAGDLFSGLFEDIRGGWNRTIGPWTGEQLAKVRTFAPMLLASILAGARGVNWDLVGSAVQTGLQTALGVLGTLGGWVLDRVRGVDWHAVTASLQTAAQIAVFGVITGAQNGLTALGQLGAWVLARLGLVDWEAIKATLALKGQEFATSVGSAFTARFPGILDWLTTTGLPDLVSGLVTGGAEMVGGLVKGLTDHWPEISTFFTTILIPGIVTLMAIGPTLLITAGIGIIRGLLDGAQQVWTNQLGPWLGDRAPEVLAFFANASDLLLRKGQEVSDGFLRGLQDTWNNRLSPWLHGVIDGLPGLFAGAGNWLASGGATVVGGLFRGMQDFWNNSLSPWFHQVLDGLPGLLAGAATWLIEGGRSLIDGLRHGIQDYWNNTLAPWMRGMKQSFLNFFAGVGTWLTNAGSDLIDGLWDGAKAKWREVERWLANLKPEFPDFRNGLTAEESAELAGERNRQGRASGGPVMAGVAYWVGERGKELFVPQVSGFVVPHGSSMAAMASPPAATPAGQSAGAARSGSQGTVVHQTVHVTVNLHELEEMVEAGRFVRDLDSARTLYLGATS